MLLHFVDSTDEVGAGELMDSWTMMYLFPATQHGVYLPMQLTDSFSPVHIHINERVEAYAAVVLASSHTKD